MKRIRTILAFAILTSGLFGFQSGYTQEVKYSPDRKFSAEQLQKDFAILNQTLWEAHPGITDYITKDSLMACYTSAYHSMKDGLTEYEFNVFLRKYVAKLRCGHTVVLPSDNFYTYHRSNKCILPVNFYIENDRLFISNNHTDHPELCRGTEILSINNIPAEQILRDMKEIHAVDGNSETFIRPATETAFGVYFVQLYGDQKEFSFGIRDSDGNNKTVVAASIKTDWFPVPEAYDTSGFSLEQKTSQAKLLRSKTMKDLAILDMDGFQNKGYRKFYSESFRKIRNDSIQHLVIDLRNDGGGYFLNATTLLSYLLDKNNEIRFYRTKNRFTYKQDIHIDKLSRLTRFAFGLRNDSKRKDNIKTFHLRYKPKKRNHYNGSLYVLTNGGSFSISCYTSAKLKNDSKAVFIGEETGGSESGANGILFSTLTLPETRTRVVIPLYHVINGAKHETNGRGILPDFPVSYPIRDRINKTDLEMEVVRKLILSKGNNILPQ